MTNDLSLRDVGLDTLAACLRQEGLARIASAGAVETIIGRCGEAGTRRPLPSSAVRLSLDDRDVWIPAPSRPGMPEQGDAPIYQVGGADYVLPTVRLFGRQGEPSYLSLSEWILNAFTVWQFATTARGRERATVIDRLKARARELPPERVIAVVAEVVRLALLGSRPADAHRAASLALGLRLPSPPREVLPCWLRRVSPRSDLAEAVARRQVLTVALGENGLPRVSQKSGHRVRPAIGHDRGIDPVHTPEDKEKIRFVGYLGVGVGIKEGRLVLPEGCLVHLSPSTVRIPFARFDAPRRLLIAANMQAQAVEVLDGRKAVPLVRVADAGSDPPGIDLRVGYLAWRGLNHEDGWVLSRSAARKLSTINTRVQAVPIPALEAAPEILVHEGETVRRGQVLLRRRASPALLAPDMDGLVALGPLNCDLIRLELERDESVEAGTSGTVVKVEVWNLATGEGGPGDEFYVPRGTAGNYRMVVRFYLRQELPLEAGDKLANRHGHKGIVGRILPDEEMPRWRGEPLDALIDPVSVLNRSSWGQVYETLLGSILDRADGSRPLTPY
jgi:hypothetical protein